MLIDTHCHLTSNYFNDIDEIISKAKSKDVGLLIASCCNVKDIDEYLNLIKKDEIYLTLGIHPEDVLIYQECDILLIKNLLNNEKIIGIGEIGLDYHYSKENKNEQIILFEKMLQLAKEYNLPVVIHSRDATKDTIEILKKYQVKGIIHCFSGSLETAKEYIKMGFYLGIGGVVTFKNSNLKEVIKEIGLNHIVLETDSPYLSPYRGKVNNPSNIYEIANFLAQLLNISYEEVKKITSDNVKKIFKI